MTDKLPERRMYIIPALPKKDIDVAIYCRVSTEHGSQDESLETQIAMLKDYAALNPEWTLYKIYTDRDSGGNTARWGFREMIINAYDHRFRIVLVKTISRFARNTGSFGKRSRAAQVFGHRNLLLPGAAQHQRKAATTFVLTPAPSPSGERIHRGCIHWGDPDAPDFGVSQLYARDALDIATTRRGNLSPTRSGRGGSADLRSVSGRASILSSLRELAAGRSNRPGQRLGQGGGADNPRNEKYTGMCWGKTYTGRFPRNRQYVNHGEREMFLAKNAHAPIINQETFDQAQTERTRRSSINLADGQEKRKNTHYSSKRDRPKPKE
jgi:hypothetical protein